jgi:hypothetical protein
MFVNFFATFFRRAARPSAPRAFAALAASCLARLDGFGWLAAVPELIADCRASGHAHDCAGPCARCLAGRAMQTAARAAVRTLHAGNSLTPTGYLILVLTVAGMAAVVTLSRIARPYELKAVMAGLGRLTV